MKQNKGFTLIELMIVVVIVAILAAIAIPTYQSYVRRARRSDALVAIQNVQSLLESCYNTYNSFDSSNCTTLPTTSPQGNYQLTVIKTATSYKIVATAIGTQAKDTQCAKFTLDDTNDREAFDASGDNTTSKCY